MIVKMNWHENRRGEYFFEVDSLPEGFFEMSNWDQYDYLHERSVIEEEHIIRSDFSFSDITVAG